MQTRWFPSIIPTKRYLRSSITILSVGFSVSACTSVSVQTAYPNIFELGSPRPLLPSTVNRFALGDGAKIYEFPTSLLSLLPPEYGIAHYTGHLLCLMDENASLTFPRFEDGRLQYYRRSFELTPRFIETANRFRRLGYHEYSLPGYPMIRCYVPTLDTQVLLNSDWEDDWDRYLEHWQERKHQIFSLEQSIVKTSQEIGDNSRLVSELDRQIVELDRRVAVLKSQIQESKSDLSAVHALAAIAGDGAPFEPTIKYDSSNDPFNAPFLESLTPLPAGLKDQGNRSDYVDAELLEAIKSFNDALKDPLRNFPRPLADDIVADGLKPVKLSSGARSIWLQAVVKSDKRKNHAPTPTAAYIDSEHAFGLAVDISATGQTWDVQKPENRTPERLKAWNTLNAALRQFGMLMPLGIKDPNHVTLLKYSGANFSKANVKRLSILRTMEGVATEQALSQTAQEHQLKTMNGTLVKDKEKLLNDVATRRKKIEEKTSYTEQLQHELSQAQVERARRDAEREQARRAAERANEKNDRADRGPRGDFDKPDRQPRDVDAGGHTGEGPSHEAPQREKPQREAPSRDRDEGTRTGGRILG